MTRKEHLQWAKDRAMEYVKRGDLRSAFASMGSDLQKHDETKDHTGMQIGLSMMIAGQLDTPKQMEEFILGFN